MELKKNSLLYNSHLVKKFICDLTKKGKVHKTAKALYLSLQTLKVTTQLSSLTLFLFILTEIKPSIILKTIRLGSVSYSIPVPLPPRKQYFKAIKILVKTIRDSKFSGPLNFKIYKEFLLILKGTSPILKLKAELYKTASSSRSFLHYR